jgi:co-chaperonin GroES (HSP10)
MSNFAFSAKQIKNLQPLSDNVIVYEMSFEEQKTASGIVLRSDDGKTHGIRPRWAKVYAIGPEQKDVTVGEWVLIEHGRWTRGIKIDDGEGEKVIRKVDVAAILASSDQPCTDVYIGQEYGHGSSVDIRPEDFIS